MGALVLGCNGELPEAEVRGASFMLLSLDDQPLRRPAALFPHGKHAAALKQEGCKTCHTITADGAVGEFVADKGIGRDGMMERYHQKCMGCHRDRSKALSKPLPQACGECHRTGKRSSKSQWRLLAFDYSLHHRHVQATGQEQCKTCHHVYNEEKQALEYKKGAEGRCGDCHGTTGKGKVLSLRNASHKACVTCHNQRASQGKKTGPVSCDGCHDKVRQQALPGVKDMPRLVSGQKDSVVIKTPGVKTPAVAFDHKLHESTGKFCTTCHHKTIRGASHWADRARRSHWTHRHEERRARAGGTQPTNDTAGDFKDKLGDGSSVVRISWACGECHGQMGSRDGGGVTLEKAHHHSTSQHSCVGCHNKQLAKESCAGCHHMLGQPPGSGSCKVCHGGAPASQPSPAPLPAASDAFPENIEIKGLAHKYEPSEFPHRKIVARLYNDIRGSKLAAAFHGRIETLCAGCHHHTPVGARPSSCKSCHGKEGHPTKDRPSLKVAYHRQCIGCHQQMNIKEQGCTDCHARGEVKK